MAKRFIDTELFDDPWFMDLSLSGKILWIYCITKCNHAGIIELNIKLAQFQCGIKGIETVIKELGNRLISVNNCYYFIPKYIDFQYPGFPNSRVRQQASAIEILKKFNLFDEQKQTVSKELSNTYVNDTVNVTVNDTVNDTVNVKEERPSWEEFKQYAIEKKPNLDQPDLKLKYNAWIENGWKDGKDQPIKIWRSKLLQTLPYIKESEQKSQYKKL